MIKELKIIILAVSLPIAVWAVSGCMEKESDMNESGFKEGHLGNESGMEGTPIRFGAAAYYRGKATLTKASPDGDLTHEPLTKASPGGDITHEPITKTSYSGDLIYDEDTTVERIDWTDGDLITIYSEQSPERSAVYAVENHAEEGKKSYASVISAEESGNGLTWGSGQHTFYAAYPAAKTTIEGNIITGEVPSNQTVTNDGESFSVDMSLAAMWAGASGNPESSPSVRLNFHPMVSAFRFTLYGKNATPQTLESFSLSSSEGPLAGTIKATVKDDLSGVDYDFSDTSDRISVDLGNAEVTNEKSITFTVFCLPRDITSLTASLETSDGPRKLDFKKAGEWVTFPGETKTDIKDLIVCPPSRNFEGTATGSFPVKIVKVIGYNPVETVETVTVTPDETGFFSVELPALPDGTHYIIDGSSILTTVTKMPEVISKDGSIQRLFYNCTKLVSTCPFNTSGITEFLYAFYNCCELLEGPDIDTSSGERFDQFFRYCKKMKRVPNYDFSNATGISYTFDYCSSLEEIPCFNIGTKPKSMNYTFQHCESVKELPPLDFTSVSSIQCIFRYCTSVKEIPTYDFSSVKRLNRAFSYCTSLESVPMFNMGTTTKEMEFTFEYCKALTDVAIFDITHVTTMEGAFQYCKSLTEVPLFDYSFVQSLRSTFEGCSGIVSVPAISTGNVTDWRNTFFGCTSLKDITPFDTSSGTNCSNMFKKCTSLEHLPWFDLSNCTYFLDFLMGTPLPSCEGFGAIAADIEFTDTYLDRESLVKIFEQAATVSGKKITLQTQYTNHNLYEKLTEEDIALATDKGWSIEH